MKEYGFPGKFAGSHVHLNIHGALLKKEEKEISENATNQSESMEMHSYDAAFFFGFYGRDTSTFPQK